MVKSSTVPLPLLKFAKLPKQPGERIHYLHDSIRTAKAYVYWVRATIGFDNFRHPTPLSPARSRTEIVVCFREIVRMAPMWWEPTYKSHSHVIVIAC